MILRVLEKGFPLFEVDWIPLHFLLFCFGLWLLFLLRLVFRLLGWRVFLWRFVDVVKVKGFGIVGEGEFLLGWLF